MNGINLTREQVERLAELITRLDECALVQGMSDMRENKTSVELMDRRKEHAAEISKILNYPILII